MNEQLMWYVTRSSGLVSWGLCSAAVIWGLALSTRALGKKPPAPWLLDLHRFLGGLSVVFVAVHVGGAVADNYVHFGWADVLVPMASEWRPGAVAWGVVGLYVLVAIELTSLLMRRLPKKLWHTVHLTSFVLFVSATIHGLAAGADADNPVYQWAALLSCSAVLFFTLYRFMAPRRAARRGGPVPAPSGRAPVPA
ncbi:MAG TPA: ferric reductase-like transmembrane domain-containing protein [Acidimicrobiales bacterium]|jgi:DMSO/TMAO reductase YedYZ heme-binding membrane subunit